MATLRRVITAQCKKYEVVHVREANKLGTVAIKYDGGPLVELREDEFMAFAEAVEAMALEIRGW